VKSQPVIIYKSRMGIPVETRRFRTSQGKDGAMAWLRSEGCRFSNNLFYNLGNDSVEITTMEFEYEIEAAPLGVSATRRKRIVVGKNKG